MRFDRTLLLKGSPLHMAAREVALLCCICFAFLLVLVKMFPVLQLDVAITREMQEGNPFLWRPVMSAISVFGAPWIASLSIIAASAAFYFLSYRREALFTLGVFLADGANGLIKYATSRPRPTANLVDVFQNLTDPSFPSGHVVHYVVFFGYLYIVLLWIHNFTGWRLYAVSAFFLGLIAFISVSRVYLGVHWATDVLGGYMVGFGMLWVMLHMYFKETGAVQAVR